MSRNQSRTDRSESTQYRKTGRSGSFNQQRQFSGDASNKGGGGASIPSVPSNHSFNKKYDSNAQGGQMRPRSPNVSSDSSTSSAAPAIQNGILQQQQPRRVSDAPVIGTAANVKPTGAHDKKVNGAVTKAVSSNVPYAAQPSNVSSDFDSKVTATPEKAPEDASKSFPLQFGSISPGFMNGVQIPARTSSAPPNLDEQRKAQAHHESLRAAPAVPVPSIPKQQSSKNDARIVDQNNSREPQTPSKSKKENQVPAVPHVNPSQKPAVHPHPGTSLPMPLPMLLSIGNPGQHAMFVSSLPPHPMQSQGMTHQGQSSNFSSQMGPQITPLLGNMGMNIAPQFPQQQAGKYSGSRKTVKITHPETQEESRLDGSTGPKSHLNVPPQSQPIPSFPNHPINFYSNFFPPRSSVPLNSTQVPPNSQPPRFYNQVTVRPAVVSHGDKELGPSKGSLSSGDTESSETSKLHGGNLVQSQRAIEPSSLSYLPQSKPDLATASSHGLPAGPAEVKNDACSTSNLTSAPTDNSASKPMDTANDVRMGVLLYSAKGNHRKLSNKGNQDEVVGKSTSSTGLPSQLPQNDVLEQLSSSRNNLVSGTAKGSFSTTIHVASDVNLPSDCDAAKNLATHGLSIRQSNLKTMSRKEKGESILPESSKPDGHSLESSLKSISLECLEVLAISGESSSKDVTTIDNLEASTKKTGGDNNERSVSAFGLLAQNGQPSTSNDSSNMLDSIDSSKTTLTQCPDVDRESAPVSVPRNPRVQLSNSMKLSSRVIFMLRDSIDLRKNKWLRGNYGVPRNPRAQAPFQYVGGILSWPMQSLGPQGGMPRNNSDSDRWHRGTNFQKGLMPSPQGPVPVIHRAEKKYEVGRVTDEEEAKQRQLKGILNKLMPQNFEKLYEQVKQVGIDNVITLCGMISQIFDKALMEPILCEMYANFCFHLSADLPGLIVDNEKITFKRLLLNKCQEEFERGEREEEEANKAEVEGEVKQMAGEREEKRIQARRRMLGNIRLIGELYKRMMLTERIMHECITKLLGQQDNPDEENIEALCKLMSTIGDMIDHPRAKKYMDYYFKFMAQLSNSMKLSSRVRFMLRDSIDLRKNKWQQRRKVEGPKKTRAERSGVQPSKLNQSCRLRSGADQL